MGAELLDMVNGSGYPWTISSLQKHANAAISCNNFLAVVWCHRRGRLVDKQCLTLAIATRDVVVRRIECEKVSSEHLPLGGAHRSHGQQEG